MTWTQSLSRSGLSAALLVAAGACASVSAQDASIAVGDVTVTHYTAAGMTAPAWAEGVLVEFGRDASGVLTAPADGLEREVLSIGGIGGLAAERMDEKGLRLMLSSLVDALERRGSAGYAVPDDRAVILGGGLRDVRRGGRDVLPITLFTTGPATPVERVPEADETRNVSIRAARIDGDEPGAVTEIDFDRADTAETDTKSEAAAQPANTAPIQQIPDAPQPQQLDPNVQPDIPEGSEPLPRRRRPAPRPYDLGPGRTLVGDRVYDENGNLIEVLDSGVRPSVAELLAERGRGSGELEVLIEAPPVEAQIGDGNAFPISRIDLEYSNDHPQLPPAERLRGRTVLLTPTPTGYTVPRDGATIVRVSIERLTEDGPVRMHASGIQAVMDAVFEGLTNDPELTGNLDLIGVFVTPDPNQILLTRENGGTDLRGGGDTALTLQVFTARVAAVRSIASGDRVPSERRIDSKEHRVIRQHSPLKPATDGGNDDLLRRKPLEEYAARLSRHPGRRVDVAIAPADSTQGNAEVQYLVRESKPWRLFYQVSNTGVDSVEVIRQRFGFFHNQLTGNDDTFSIDYITAGFRESNAVLASYERPLWDNSPIRWNVNGSWSEFNADEVGEFDEDFSGESWFWSSELIWNVAQEGAAFLDVFGGLRYQWSQINNEAIDDGIGEEAIFLPRIGVRAERTTEATNLFGEFFVEWTQNDVAGTSEDSLEELGRLQPSRDWVTLKWDFQASAFLEPLLNPNGYADPSTPASSTLAHEIAASFRGQYAFNDRLIPQEQQVIGGLFSVRGYPESVAAGDTAWVASLEYRFHVPRAFTPGEPANVFGRRFRWRPETVYGQPDWDFVVKAFWDIGEVQVNRALAFEDDQTLQSIGGGFDILLGQNISFRTDLGVVMEDLTDVDVPETDFGDFRLHFLLTVLY
ncbi:MAG: ShlB/FhaC/HecB family hemolysin secretion/activation protein [Planctomycetota bacterium]